MDSVLIVIDSKDRSSPTDTSSNFTLNYKNNSRLSRITSFFVKSVTFPNVEYNIHNTYKSEPANNVLYIETIGGLQAPIIIPIGQYTISQLITALQTSATGVTIGLTVIQDPITNKLTFNTTSPGGVKIYARNDSSPTNSTLAPNVGILSTSPIFSSSIVAEGLPSLSGNQNIYILSDKLSGSGAQLVDARLGNVQAIATIPVNVPFGENVHNEPDKDLITSSDGFYFNLDSIDIKLFGDYGQILDLQGENFTMILKAYYDP